MKAIKTHSQLHIQTSTQIQKKRKSINFILGIKNK